MAAAAPARAPGRNGLMMAAVIVMLLSLVGAGAGFAVGALLAPSVPLPLASGQPGGSIKDKKLNATEIEHSASGGEAKDDPPALISVQEPMQILPLPPILTNLAEPRETWVRLEGSLLLKKDTDDPPPILVEHAGQQVLTLLRTEKLSEIAGPSGFLNLRTDLNDTVAAGSGGQVREVLIHSLVME